MYQTFVGIIEEGGFDLDEMLHRIDYYHVAGQLTDGEREQLTAYAREKAVESQQLDPQTEIRALWAAVRELQAAVNQSGGGTPAEEYPAFSQPTGAHDAYYTGDGITWNGQRYRSKIDGNVWSPETYPAGWELVNE